MAVMTFNLEDGFKVGDAQCHEVGLKELTPKDVFDAQLASEKIGILNGRPHAYTSDVQMGMELYVVKWSLLVTYKVHLASKRF